METTTDAQTIAPEQAQQMQSWMGTLSPDQRDGLNQAMSVDADDLPTEFNSFLKSLPPGMQDNLRMIIDVKNLTPEQLRGLVAGGEATENMTNLAFAGRGSDGNPLDWKKRADEDDKPRQGTHISEERLMQLQRKDTPFLRERDKGVDLPDL